jgi:ribosomal protein S18 acetylase RimI-like enzyme
MTVHHHTIRQTEEHLMNAWPALRTVMCDGWVFREAGGYTKRANSASALESRGNIVPTLMEAERFYGSLGAPAVFRLSPLAGPDTDRILEDLGYRVLDKTIVMTTPLACAAAMEETVSIERHCAGGWESGYADAHVLAASERRAHRAILDRIAPLKTAFATATVDGRAVAFGLGVVERDRLGLFDIVTVPEARRLGVARKLVSALMAWGAAEDATTAWLSVIADNEKAKPLYAQLGFREQYRYHYRVAV